MSRTAFLTASLLLSALAQAQMMRGVNVSGAEFGNSSIPGTYNTNYTYNSPLTFNYFAARELKFIRLQFLWERLQPVLGGPLDPANLGYLKQDVAWAKAAGAQLSIEPHNFARYSINESGALNTYVIDNVYNGVVKVSAADLADFWVKLSNEFMNEPAVVSYDLMNEPHDMGTASWNQISQTVLSAIRANGDNKLIMVPGNSYSNATFWASVNGATSWISDPAGNFFYEAHEYFDSDYSGTYAETYDAELAANPQLAQVGVTRLAPFITWCQNNNVKGYLGEYGIPNTDPRWLTVLDNFLTSLDAAGFSGTYWSAGEWWGTYALSVQPLDSFTIDREQTPTLLAHLPPGLIRTASAAASFGYAVAPGSLVSGYGNGFSVGTASAAMVPLPMTLAEAQIQLTDSAGTVSRAPLLYASPTQINYQVPAGTAVGRVDVEVLNSGVQVSTGVLEVNPVAPTIFAANGNGTGVAAAQVQRVAADGSVTYEYASMYDSALGTSVPVPIVFGSDKLFLVLYGTGFDQVHSASAVQVLVNGQLLTPNFAGSQNQFPGLDQIDVPLPNSLAGSGTVTVTVLVNGIAANNTTIAFQ
jgi:endoglucanase